MSAHASTTTLTIPGSAEAVLPRAAAEPAAPRDCTLAASLVELTKPGITRLVTITSAVGFAMAALSRLAVAPVSWASLAIAGAGAIVGTVLSAAGANALNEWWERGLDARMPRTRRRPLPEGRITPGLAAAFGSLLCIAGCALLWAVCGLAPALVSAATILSYLLIYTPLKPVTPLATLIGAVPGALPPLIGWSAGILAGTGLSGSEALAASLSGAGGWALFTLMFVWQIPHFLAIAWMYREDYAAGGYRVLPVVEPDGATTSAVVLLWTFTLMVAMVGPALVMPDLVGVIYLGVATLTGVPFCIAAVRLARRRTRDLAKRVFIASVVQLPLVLGALVLDGFVQVL